MAAPRKKSEDLRAINALGAAFAALVVQLTGLPCPKCGEYRLTIEAGLRLDITCESCEAAFPYRYGEPAPRAPVVTLADRPKIGVLLTD